MWGDPAKGFFAQIPIEFIVSNGHLAATSQMRGFLGFSLICFGPATLESHPPGPPGIITFEPKKRGQKKSGARK